MSLEREYNIAIGKVLAGKALTEDESTWFVEQLSKMERMLDEGDQDDYFGTEGWRHNMGWD